MTEVQMLMISSYEKWKRNMCMLLTLLSYQFLSDTNGLNVDQKTVGAIDVSVKNYG
jgi:hypothetical protein